MRSIVCAALAVVTAARAGLRTGSARPDSGQRHDHVQRRPAAGGRIDLLRPHQRRGRVSPPAGKQPLRQQRAILRLIVRRRRRAGAGHVSRAFRVLEGRADDGRRQSRLSATYRRTSIRMYWSSPPPAAASPKTTTCRSPNRPAATRRRPTHRGVARRRTAMSTTNSSRAAAAKYCHSGFENGAGEPANWGDFRGRGIESPA